VPKNISIFVDRELTDLVTAGSRIKVSGVYQIIGEKGSLNAAKGKEGEKGVKTC